MKAKVPPEMDHLDKKVVDYIQRIRFRPKAFGADVKDLWTVVANIQQYYDEKLRDKEGPQIIRSDIVGGAILIRKRRVQSRQIWGNIFVRLALFLLVVWGIFSFVLGIETIRVDDMYPAVRNGDLAIFIRIVNYRKEDVVLYDDTIGRIQGTEGMRVDRTGAGKLTIDGNLQPVQSRAGIFYETETSEDDVLRYPSRVSKGHYLILGDQREHASDSRIRGFIPRCRLRGKVFMVIKRRAL